MSKEKPVFIKEGKNQGASIFDVLKVQKQNPYDPILPTLARTLLTVRLAENWQTQTDQVVEWVLFGDSAPRRVGQMSVAELWRDGSH